MTMEKINRTIAFPNNRTMITRFSLIWFYCCFNCTTGIEGELQKPW